MGQTVYVSATPADWELEQAREAITELIVRPTGLIDPEIEVRKAEHQVDDLYDEIQQRIQRNERVLVTTLTKRMAEDLCEYYSELGIAVQYLHADVNTLERMEIIRDLRMGKFDVLIGINLLREGLDLPEVSLVAVLDADKEGFLRSARSLIQTCGRAARNVSGKVILYADTVTPSMQKALEETGRRRKIQEAYNRQHGITPTTIRKNVAQTFDFVYQNQETAHSKVAEAVTEYGSPDKLEKMIAQLEKEMKAAAKDLAFEKAAQLRDRIRDLRNLLVFE